MVNGGCVMEHKMNKGDAICSLRQKASFGYDPDTGEISQWQDPDGASIPSDSEISAEITRLQAEYDAKKYQRDRQVEYPDWATQLDYIYHNGIEKWKTDIVDPVKKKYPKPE